jgi:hypothetical protein
MTCCVTRNNLVSRLRSRAHITDPRVATYLTAAASPALRIPSIT